MGFTKTTITEIADEVVPKQFDAAMQQVIDNIQDLRTEEKAKREITIKITCYPNAERQHMIVDAQTSVKLAPPKAHESVVYFVPDPKTGQIVGVNQNPSQMTMGWGKSKDDITAPIDSEAKPK